MKMTNPFALLRTVASKAGTQEHSVRATFNKGTVDAALRAGTVEVLVSGVMQVTAKGQEVLALLVK